MPVIFRLVGVTLVLLAMATTSSAAVVVGYNPSVRNGGFEDADYLNAGGPSGQWQDSSGQNRITNANDLGVGPVGPSSASGGIFFGYSNPTAGGPQVSLTNPQPVVDGQAPLPAKISSFDLDFDLAGSGSFNTSQTLVNVRLFEFGTALQEGFDLALTPDGTPTTWQHVSYHVDGPFLDGDTSAPFSNIGAFRLKFLSRTTSGDGYIFVDNVQLTLNEVPEPASLGVLGIGAGSLLQRRRSKQS